MNGHRVNSIWAGENDPLDRKAHKQSWCRRLAGGVAVRLAFLTLSVAAASHSQAQGLEWRSRSTTGPSPRSSFAMAYDSARGVTVLFGGNSGTGNLGDTWEWNGTVWTERSVPGPSARRNHRMAYDSIRHQTVLFGGGSSGSSQNGETWEWNGTTWTQRVVSGPSGRSIQGMAFDSVRGVTVMYGGYLGGNDFSGETWEWNGTAWNARAGSTARGNHAMVFDSLRNRTVSSFGNYDTLEWNGTSWSNPTSSGPVPRQAHSMAFDSARGVSVVFGGNYSSTFYADTWEWDGRTWTQQLITGPSARHDFAMVYDSARNVCVLFGGITNNGMNGETWELRPPCPGPVISTQPVVDQSAVPGTPVTLYVVAQPAVPCSTPLTYQWQRENPVNSNNWQDLSDDAVFLNTRTSALLITSPTMGLMTSYRCKVTGCGCDPGTTVTTTSTPGSYQFVCPADFNADGGVDGQDVSAFFERWEAGC